MPDQTRQPLLTANLMCMASMFIWAASLPAAEPLIAALPPLPLTAMRMTLAAIALFPAWWIADGGRAVLRARWGRGLLIGALAFGGGAFLLVLGQLLSDPVTTAIVAASMPVVGIALEVALDGRRLTPALVAGLVLSLVGGLVALSRGGAPGLGLGALACLGSVIVFTLGSRLTVTAFPDLTPIGRTAITLVGAAVGTLLAAGLQVAAGGTAGDWIGIGASGWVAMLIYSVGGLGLSQVLWIRSVGSLGIGLAALHINAAPFYVMLILFGLGHPWNWMQALGAVIVGLGVLVAQNLLPRRARRIHRT